METYNKKTPEEETLTTSIKVDLKYYINNNQEMNGKLNLIYDANSYTIQYDEIAYNFYFFLKDIPQNDNLEWTHLDFNLNDINFEFIRYFNGKGWILLENGDCILGETLINNNLRIMIKANILSEEKMKVLSNCKNIEKEINLIYQDLAKKNRTNYKDSNQLNLIVLTANPLTHEKSLLRTMNDFHIITSKIYELLKEEDYLKYTEFLPLTMSTFIEILSNEERCPVILHLICKSVYIFENNDLKNNEDEQKINSELYTNLIFEMDKNNKPENKYDSEFIDKFQLESIFKSNKKIGENIKKVTLIISTPLAEDVYDLFKDFGFKNLLVQHTTLADVNFIANFNYAFYKELIIRQEALPINKLFEIALNIYSEKKNPPTFCCCFHKHKNNCKLLKNMVNELYNNDNNNNIEELLPHFVHLFPDCVGDQCHDRICSRRGKLIKNPQKYFQYSFSFHYKDCVDELKYINTNNIIKLLNNNGEFYYKDFCNICCCNEAIEKHNKNYIFIKNFDEKTNNNLIEFTLPKMTREKKFMPNYSKMELLVGKNEIILDVLNFFYSTKKFYNIYGDSLENLKTLANVIIECYKEKCYYYLYESDNLEPQDNQLKKIYSQPQLIHRIPRIDSGLSDNFNEADKSYAILPNPQEIKKIDFKVIDLGGGENFNLKNELGNGDINNNKIFFICVPENLLNKIDKINKTNGKIIFLSKEKLENIKINETKKVVPILEPEILYEKKEEKKEEIKPNLYNSYIYHQLKKDVRNKWRKKYIF